MSGGCRQPGAAPLLLADRLGPALCLLLPALVACGPPAPDGHALYHEHCASCHAADGTGDPRRVKLAPGVDLTRSAMVKAGLDGRIFRAISYGVEGMPGFAHQLEIKEIQAITRVVLELGTEPAASPGSGERPAKSGGAS